MLVFLTTSGHRFTVRMYLASWGRPLAHRIVPLTYEDALACRTLRTATYVFADLERLTPAATERAARLCDALAAHGLRVLNHPARTLRRYELLRTLQAAGINRFGVYRAGEGATPRFPVFLRGENDHQGSRTALLHDAEALAAAVATLERAGTAREEMLVTEYCDTRDARGVYRKYSAFVIGDRIVARHVFFSRGWMIKYPDLVDDDAVREELAYIESNPHERELRDIFRVARLDWGRIDYAVASDGRLQVWEINTNRQIMSFDDGGGSRRLPAHARVAVVLRAALEAIDSVAPPQRLAVPTSEPAALASALAPRGLARAFLRRTGLIWHEEQLRHLWSTMPPLAFGSRSSARPRRESGS